MLPFCFEWTWDVGRIIFMGLLYLVLGAISLGLFYTLAITWLKFTGRDKLLKRLWLRFPFTLW